MRIIAISLLFVWVSVFIAGCAKLDRSQAAGRCASEKAIIMAMRQGLLGLSFASLSRDGRRRALEAEYRSLEYAKVGEAVAWNAKNGTAFGNVVPGQPYRVGSQNCRQYSHSFTINGISRTVRGSACRNSDGSWMPLT